MSELRRFDVLGGGLFSVSSRALMPLYNALVAAFRSAESLLFNVTMANRKVFWSLNWQFILNLVLLRP